LCFEQFNMLLKKRNYCKKCGSSVCELCSQSSRRLSKSDKREYRVCDACDHHLSNSLFNLKMQEEIAKRKEISSQLKDQMKETER